APVESATRPRMRPPVLWPEAGKKSKRTAAMTVRQKVVRRNVGEDMQRLRVSTSEFISDRSCVRNKPCYNPVRLVRGEENCQAKTCSRSWRARAPAPHRPP